MAQKRTVIFFLCQFYLKYPHALYVLFQLFYRQKLKTEIGMVTKNGKAGDKILAIRATVDLWPACVPLPCKFRVWYIFHFLRRTFLHMQSAQIYILGGFLELRLNYAVDVSKNLGWKQEATSFLFYLQAKYTYREGSFIFRYYYLHLVMLDLCFLLGSLILNFGCFLFVLI